MAIHKSGEDYLEAILMIRLEKGYCRSIDVAHHLNVSKPSVSVAMGFFLSPQAVSTPSSMHTARVRAKTRFSCFIASSSKGPNPFLRAHCFVYYTKKPADLQPKPQVF